ncbi:hypothetical protein HUN08_06995 [Gordonia sp. X0973]|uniref:hypothetical protein n=1 Tax=Gordonia sp. X0973 TaxID=2742602 RepID=UPI000F543F99|nr:hypothetical protein [Gordonia sp. X0973]QKT06965.1 hypothetical protein HUN08_06995 [Gordonia sp. X0973]
MKPKRTRVFAALPIALALLVAVSSCHLAGRKSAPTAVKPCTGSFRYADGPTPLGSNEAFLQALQRAALAGRPTTLEQITDAAGWPREAAADWPSPRYTHVVVYSARAGFTKADLDEMTYSDQHSPPPPCWHGFDFRSPPDPAGNHGGTYIFQDSLTPVQSVPWTGSHPILYSTERKARITWEQKLIPYRAGPDGIPLLLAEPEWSVPYR